jgi:hypothetical protein
MRTATLPLPLADLSSTRRDGKALDKHPADRSKTVRNLFQKAFAEATKLVAFEGNAIVLKNLGAVKCRSAEPRQRGPVAMHNKKILGKSRPAPPLTGC